MMKITQRTCIHFTLTFTFWKPLAFVHDKLINQLKYHCAWSSTFAKKTQIYCFEKWSWICSNTTDFTALPFLILASNGYLYSVRSYPNKVGYFATHTSRSGKSSYFNWSGWQRFARYPSITGGTAQNQASCDGASRNTCLWTGLQDPMFRAFEPDFNYYLWSQS